MILIQFDRRAADFVIFMFAYWGVSQLVMCPVFIAILWRYNSLIPFMCLLIFSEWALRFYIARDKTFHTLSANKDMRDTTVGSPLVHNIQG